MIFASQINCRFFCENLPPLAARRAKALLFITQGTFAKHWQQSIIHISRSKDESMLCNFPSRLVKIFKRNERNETLLTFWAVRGRLRATEAAKRADNIDILEFNLLNREILFVTEFVFLSLDDFPMSFRRTRSRSEFAVERTEWRHWRRTFVLYRRFDLKSMACIICGRQGCNLEDFRGQPLGIVIMQSLGDVRRAEFASQNRVRSLFGLCTSRSDWDALRSSLFKLAALPVYGPILLIVI